MKLGVVNVPYQALPFTEALDKIAALGVEAIEIGTGGYPGAHHCNPDELLGDSSAQSTFKKEIAARDLTIGAFSCHGNPLHPNEDMARASHETWRKTARLAEELEVPVVNLFSGCPGDGESARYPNWVTCAWPDDFGEILEWQWNEKIIPYWTEESTVASQHGVRVAFEMHPGFSVYNPESLLRVRAACGDNLGANFDPSHLYWQGIDPVEAIRALGAADAIFHFHAKDTYIDPINTRVHGVLDTKSYSQIPERSWSFRTVGYGHNETSWRNQISALRTVGYDYVISIEHEDALMSIDEGLRKAVEFLAPLVIKEQPAEMWWA